MISQNLWNILITEEIRAVLSAVFLCHHQSCIVCSFSVSSQFTLAKAAKVWPFVKWKNGFHNWIFGEKSCHSWARKNSFDFELVDFHISYFKCVWFLVFHYLPINVQWFGSKSGGTVVHAADEEVHLFDETEYLLKTFIWINEMHT